MPAFFSAASGGESGTFSLLFLIPLAFFAYLIFAQRRRAKREAKAQQGLQIGDAVATRAGIFGAVEGLEGPSVRVLVAPGVVLTFDRRAVMPAVVPAASETTDKPDGTDPDDIDPHRTQGDNN